MTFKPVSFVVAASLFAVVGCQNGTQPQRDAALGAAGGAALGAAISEDKKTGALVGGAIGAAAGYYTGCRRQGGCYIGGTQVNSGLVYDDRADRYYFRDPNSGATYWQNGDIRTQ